MGTLGKKLVGGALGVAATAASVAKHVAWYVTYQMGHDRDERS